MKLPPSYRTFLKVTNGWRRMGFFVDELWPAAKIEWFRVAHQEWIDDWNAGAGSAAVGDSDARYLPATLQTSNVGDSVVYLLNP